MISMNDINAMLLQNFQRQLQEVNSLPETLARGYKDWVRGLIKQAAQIVQGEQQVQPAQGTQEAAQEKQEVQEETTDVQTNK